MEGCLINAGWLIGLLLELYILATSKVIPGWVLTCDSAYSSRLCNTDIVGLLEPRPNHIILKRCYPVLVLSY